MKILIVHNSYQQPGGEDVVFSQERRLLESAGHEVVTYERSNWETEGYRGLRKLALISNTIWSTDTRRAFSQVLRRHDPHLVHIHNTFIMISPSIYAACREARVPVVQTLHNYRMRCPASTFFREGSVCEECVEHSLARSVMHGCYRDSRSATAVVATMLAIHNRRHSITDNVDCFIALTEFARRKFVQCGFPGDRILVKPNFVHPDVGEGTERREGVLFVGRLTPEKGVSTLVKAWSLLQDPAWLTVVGGGPQLQELQQQARRLGLSRVRFVGPLPREQTLAEMRRARFLVIPSEWYECFPVTIAEAFAAGTPVLCSRLGGMEEIVSDGRTGLHFEAANAQDLAGKIEWALGHSAWMLEMGSEARAEFEVKYTAEKNYSILMEIYERAMHSKIPQPVPVPVG